MNTSAGATIITLRMNLPGSRQYWNQHAASDPLWAVSSFPEKAGGRWDLQEFMRLGEREIALLFFRLSQLKLGRPAGVALDFGCGVGRLTQALARRFEVVYGVDISDGMIDLAERLNRYPGKARYFVNTAPDLRHVEPRSIDFVYSSIVLQHLEPDRAVPYLAEFVRVLRPGGLLVFQLPSHREAPHEAPIQLLPEGAYSASVQITSAPERLRGGERAEAVIALANTSRHEWRQAGVGSIRLGNHWLDASGERMIVPDDGRAVIPQVMRPGDRYDTTLPIAAPAKPGSYILEIDLVHEGVAWFGFKGSRPARVVVHVEPAIDVAPRATPEVAMVEYPVPQYDATELPPPRPSDASADFPMFGIPQKTVIEHVERHGGVIAHVEEDRRAGEDWKSFRYFVRKP